MLTYTQEREKTRNKTKQTNNNNSNNNKKYREKGGKSILKFTAWISVR